jgi:hypothetical protein
MKLFWKIYFFILLAVDISVIVFMLKFEELFSVLGFEDILSWSLSFFGMVALFGHAFSKKILNRSFWVFICALIIGHDILWGGYQSILAFPGLWNDPELDRSGIIYPIITMIIFVPYYIGVATYALRTTWSQPNQTLQPTPKSGAAEL